MDCSNVVSFKAASGTTEEVTQLRNYCGSNLAIYSGDDALVLPMLSVGAVGVVSVASHIVGPNLKKIIESFLEGKHAFMDPSKPMSTYFQKIFPPKKRTSKLKDISSSNFKPKPKPNPAETQTHWRGYATPASR